MTDSSKTLRVGLLAPVRHLDARGGRDFVGSTIVEQIFETPFAPPAEPDAPPRPVLFTGPLESGDGGRRLAGRVRDGVRFSDGTPLTADLLAKSLAEAERLAGLTESIEASGDRVVFRLPHPARHFELTLSYRYCEVALERGGRALGTGPYMLAGDSTPERTRLVPNPERPDPPEIEEVLFLSYPPDEAGRPTALLQAMEDGDVDFTNVLSREHIGTLKGVRKWLEPGSGTAILYFNTERLTDRRVRRALALAVDRSELARLSYQNPLAFTATGLLPPMLGSWRDGLAPDPKRAAALMAEAGDARPRSLEMLLVYGPRPYLPQPRTVADHLAELFGGLGVELRIRQAESMADYFEQAARGDYDLALSGWVADTSDPADFLEAIVSPECVPSADRRIVIDGNLARWREPRVADALERFRREPSEEHKAAVLEPVGEEVPLLPLMYGPTVYVYSPRVSGFRPSPLGIPRFAELSLA